MTKRRTAAIVAIVVIIVGGFGIYRSRSAQTRSAQPVRSTSVKIGTVAPTLAVTGYVSSVDERQINSNTTGRVIELAVTVGDTVTAGQTLVRLDNDLDDEHVNIAYADLTSAEARLQELKDQGASNAEITAQNNVVDEAETNYQTIVGTHEYETITSPVGGTVVAVNTVVGDQVGGGSGSPSSGGGAAEGNVGMITIANLDRLQVKAAIDQADISKIAVDQSVNITLDALSNKKFLGHVASINQVPQTSQNVVTYDAFIRLTEMDEQMRLGMSADLEINLAKKKGVVFVPNATIHSRDGKKYVSKIIDGEPTEIPVEVGLVSAERSEIVSGLSEGDQIAERSFSKEPQGQGSFSGRGGFGQGLGGPGGAPH